MLLSDGIRENGNGGAGFERNRTGSWCCMVDITSRIPRLSESRERITSILAFLRAGVSLYCLRANDNVIVSPYTRARTRVFTHVVSERIFKEAFPRGASLLKVFFTLLFRRLFLVQNIDVHIMTYNSGEFPR